MNIAVILAGGVGTRLGADVPKQFVEVLGKPIIVYTLELFQLHSEIDFIEVVCVNDYIELLNRLINKYELTKVKLIVEGGKDFQHSMINGVKGLEGIAKPDDILITSWAASPFIDKETISDNIRVCKEKGNAISAIPAYLLYGKVGDNKEYTTEGLDRETFMVMNAPNSYKYSYIKQMYEEAEEKGLLDQVEPHTTSLMYLMGRTIYFSKGNQTNIKITTKEDLDLFLGYLLAKQYKANHLYE